MSFFRDKAAYIRRQDDHFQEFKSLGVCNNPRFSSGLSHAVQMLTPEKSVRNSAVQHHLSSVREAVPRSTRSMRRYIYIDMSGTVSSSLRGLERW